MWFLNGAFSAASGCPIIYSLIYEDRRTIKVFVVIQHGYSNMMPSVSLLVLCLALLFLEKQLNCISCYQTFGGSCLDVFTELIIRTVSQKSKGVFVSSLWLPQLRRVKFLFITNRKHAFQFMWEKVRLHRAYLNRKLNVFFWYKQSVGQKARLI